MIQKTQNFPKKTFQIKLSKISFSFFFSLKWFFNFQLFYSFAEKNLKKLSSSSFHIANFLIELWIEFWLVFVSNFRSFRLHNHKKKICQMTIEKITWRNFFLSCWCFTLIYLSNIWWCDDMRGWKWVCEFFLWCDWRYFEMSSKILKIFYPNAFTNKSTKAFPVDKFNFSMTNLNSNCHSIVNISFLIAHNK